MKTLALFFLLILSLQTHAQTKKFKNPSEVFRVPLHNVRVDNSKGVILGLSFLLKASRSDGRLDVGVEGKGIPFYTGPLHDQYPQGLPLSWSRVFIAFNEVDFKDIDNLILRTHDINVEVEVKDLEYITEVKHTDWDYKIYQQSLLPNITESSNIRITRYDNVSSLWWGTPRTESAADPSVNKSVLVINDFNDGSENTLGGRMGAFKKEPSIAEIDLVSEGDGKALRIDYKKENSGWCGIWMQLYNPSTNTYLDATRFKFLTFRVKGVRGGENLTLQMGDKTWSQKDDSFPLGKLSDFITVTDKWQEVVIPLETATKGRVDLKQLATFVLNVKETVAGRIYIDDISLKTDLKVVSEKNTNTSLQQNMRGVKALWVWNTVDLLNVPNNLKDFLDFTEKEKVTHIFLQVPYTADLNEVSLQYELRMGDLLEQLHIRQIKVHALAGDKYYALNAWHAKVLSLTSKIVGYNKSVSPVRRFDAIHYDIEPYTLTGFGASYREEILLQYLKLLNSVKILTDQANIKFGVDIPFWYQSSENDENFAVTFNQKTKPANQHITDIVDYITLMNYRTTALGSNGTIRHALDEIQYATMIGKSVLVGLETGRVPNEKTYIFTKTTIVEQSKAILAIVPFKDLFIVYLKPCLTNCNKEDVAIFRSNAMLFYARNPVDTLADTISFRTKTTEEFRSVVEQTVNELRHYQGFGGIAVHHYISYKGFVEQ